MRGNRKIRKNRFRTEETESVRLNFSFMESVNLCLKFIIIIVFISLASLLFIFVHDTITQSKYFALTKVYVSPCRMISKSEIMKQAGISLGENIFAINLFKVKKRLVAHSWIENASVERKFPSRIVIRIKEQHPIAMIMIKNNHAVLINDTGVPFIDYDLGRSNHRKGVNGREKADFSFELCSAGKNRHIKLLNSSTRKVYYDLPVVTGLVLKKENGVYCFSGDLFNSVMEFLSGTYNIGWKGHFSGGIERIRVDKDIGLDLLLSACPGINRTAYKNIREFQDRGDKPECIVNLKMGFGNYQVRCRKLQRIIKYLKNKKITKKISDIDLTNLNNITVKFQKNQPGENLPDSIKGGV